MALSWTKNISFLVLNVKANCLRRRGRENRRREGERRKKERRKAKVWNFVWKLILLGMETICVRKL